MAHNPSFLSVPVFDGVDAGAFSATSSGSFLESCFLERGYRELNDPLFTGSEYST